MNSRISGIIEILNSICNRFTVQEIEEAKSEIERLGYPSKIFISPIKKSKAVRIQKRPGAAKSKKPFSEEKSNAIAALEKTDVSKYKILRQLEIEIRTGIVALRLEDIKKIGDRLTKEFNPGKSRRTALTKFFQVLAAQPEPLIKEISLEIYNRSREDDKNSFQNLADFIITGK